MIHVEHEDADELRKWGMGLEKIIENCELCRTPTRYWHDGTNTPCCQECAKTARLVAGRLTPSPRAGDSIEGEQDAKA